MNCPSCGNVNLVMSDRQGIEIDYCPTCRGVWLDRGELDKIIERSAAAAPPQQAAPPPRREEYRPDDRYRDGYKRDDDYYKHKKKKSFMSELFDF
jgi:Zn-finger nucleic acid-binding protein